MRVLLIDDNPKERGLTACALRQALPSAEIVEIGDDTALELALQAPTEPALAVTDYALTWSDGLTVFERITTAHPHCPVIVFTGVGDETLAVELLKAGVDDYVVKHGRRPLGQAAREALDAPPKRRPRGGGSFSTFGDVPANFALATIAGYQSHSPTVYGLLLRALPF